MSAIIPWLARLCSPRLLHEDEEGQSLVEYSLILLLIFIAALTVMQALGVQIKTTLFDVVQAMVP